MLKSRPGTICAVQNATCSVSAKKLSGLRFSTIRPMGVSGTSSSGTIFVASSTSKLNFSASLLREHLHGELPLRISAGLDRLPQIAAVEIRVCARDLHGFVPRERVRARCRRPVELHEPRLALRVHEPKRVHAEPLHHAIAARNRPIGHDPHQHVSRLRHQRHEIPECVVRRRRLRHGVMRLGFDGMDQVGKLHRVLDEEHGDVVAHEVPIALVRVELDCEAAHVARCIRRPSLAGDRREPYEHRRAFSGFGEQRRTRQVRERLVTFEVTVRSRAARVDDPLRDALVVEVRDLLAQDEVFEQRRAAQPRFQRILVVADRDALIRRERTA